MKTIPPRRRPGELGVLGEEAVAGMDRLGARPARRLDDLRDREVALGRHGRAEQEGLVGLAHVGRVAVGLGVDGDRADPHLLQRAQDADRDLAAIGDQDLLEHGGGSLLGAGPAAVPPDAAAANLPRRADRAAIALDRLRRPAGARRGGRGGGEGGRDDAGADRPRRDRRRAGGRRRGRASRDRAGPGGRDVLRARVRRRPARLRLLGRPRGDRARPASAPSASGSSGPEEIVENLRRRASTSPSRTRSPRPATRSRWGGPTSPAPPARARTWGRSSRSTWSRERRPSCRAAGRPPSRRSS